jgi:Winged helix-turn helix
MSRKYDCLKPGRTPTHRDGQDQQPAGCFQGQDHLGFWPGLNHEEISREQGVSLSAIGRWRKRWAAKGLEGLKTLPGGGASRRQ